MHANLWSTDPEKWRKEFPSALKITLRFHTPQLETPNGEKNLWQLETGTRPPTGAQDEDQSISWLHLPSSALERQVPLAKASRQMLQTLPFSLVGFGAIQSGGER